MWEDFTPEEFNTEKYLDSYDDEKTAKWAQYYHPNLTCEDDIWDMIISKIAESGANMVIIDLGDGVKYSSHPEIAVKGAWEVSKLKKAIKKIKAKGLEPIPKLNFSTAHKTWLHEYKYMVSSKIYYNFCSDIINEVIDIFEKPRFIHLGMDEETCDHQSSYEYTVIRRGNQWWKDFYFLVDKVESNNIRSWIWSDNVWRNKEEFLRKMPKTVLQSNWVYEERNPMFNENNEPGDELAQAFIDLEEHGFDQVPAGSLWLNGHWNNFKNFDNLVKHNKRIIAPERLKGFMQTIWMPTVKPCLNTHYQAIQLIKEAKEKYYPI
jgi:hypothetical protein